MDLVRPYILALATLLLIGIGGGCSNKYYRKAADRETYRAIRQKGTGVFNMDRQFTIEQTNVLSLEGLPVVSKVDEFFGPDTNTDRGAHIVSLERALEMAVRHSRTYQNTKEQLYLQALALTLSRHQFEPIYSAGARGDYQVVTEEVRVGVDAITGQPRALIDEGALLIEQQRVTGQGSAGVRYLLRTGARIAASFSTDFLRYLTGDPRVFSSSQVNANLIQPLWRGGGYRATMENLTQAERNLLYQLREFSRFRRNFTVQIASAYYGVLGARDAVRNSWLGLENFRRNAERERALAEEGQRTQASLGRLKQAELTTETAWISAVRSYKQSLDQFKLQLGLSTDAPIVLDDRELEDLRINHPDMSAEDAIKVALVTRLDLYNERDQFADTRRRIDLAANGLRPQIDLVASAGFNSPPNDDTGFPVPDINRYHWNAGLLVDLPFERTSERNAYRGALIAHQQAGRQLEQAGDEVKLQIRNDWRNLDQAKRNYEISEIGVELSQRRVEEQELRSQVGRGVAQDLVDAQNDLITQKNLRTQALVGHTIARLQFWNDMGILYIKDNGKWEEVTNGTAK